MQKKKYIYIGETGCLMIVQRTIYRQHIKQQLYQQLAVQEHFCIWGDGKFCMFPFFKILQGNKSIRKSYLDYFIDKFKPCSIERFKSQNLLK